MDLARRVTRLRWLVWGTVCLAFVISIFHRISLSVVADQMMRDFGITAAAFGGLVSTYFYVYTVMQIPAGLLADRWGPRRTATAGMLLAAAASFVFAWAPGVTVAYVGRVLIGLGVSVIFISILKVQTTWFRSREFGFVSGLVTLVAMVGTVLASRPLAVVAEAVGWRPAFAITGAVTLAVAVLCWLAVRDRPVDLGLPPLEPDPAADMPPLSVGRSIVTVFRNRHTWPVFLVFFGIYGPYTAFTSMWSVPFLMQAFGLNRPDAAQYVLISSLGTLAGGPAFGYAADRLFGRRKPPLAVGLAGFLLCWLAMVVWAGQAWLTRWLAPLFFAQGFFWACFVLAFPLAKEVNSPAVSGVASGTVNAAGFLSTALLQPVLGWVLDRFWTGAIAAGVPVYPLAGYQAVGWISAAVVAIALTALLATPETHCQNLAASPTKVSPVGA